MYMYVHACILELVEECDSMWQSRGRPSYILQVWVQVNYAEKEADTSLDVRLSLSDSLPTIANSLKGHGHNVSAYLRKSVNSVGGVKSTCTLYAAQLEYHTIASKIDYKCMYTEKYPDPSVVTVAL